MITLEAPSKLVKLLSPEAQRGLLEHRARALIERTRRPHLGLAEFLECQFLQRVIEVEHPHHALTYSQIPHFARWADLLARQRFVALIAFRKALKSVMARGVFAYDLYNHTVGIYDGYYYSASERLARRHVERLKMYIDPLAQAWGWQDATDGRALVRYEKRGALFLVEPEGIDSRQRGARADRLVIDDALDPQKPLTYADINRALEALSRRLLPLLKDARSRVLFVGTPICDGDVVDWIRKNESFVMDWLPIMDELGNPTWPQRFGSAEIEVERSLVGQKAFEAEYMLKSIVPIDSYISRDILEGAIIRL